MLRTDPTYRGLLSSVIQAPGDDLPRLVLADYLEENGYDKRSGFIRLQLEIARTAPSKNPELLARERELWPYSRDDFHECNADVFLPQAWAAEKHWEGWKTGWKDRGLFIVTRGFISHAHIPFSTWFSGAGESEQCRMLRWHPVEKLEILDAETVKIGRSPKPWYILNGPGNLGPFTSRQAALDGLNEYCLRSLKATN
jgi:uncharacterized protein (TIGR02996 family)